MTGKMVRFEQNGYQPTRASKTPKDHAINSIGYKSKSTTSPKVKSRQRRRTEKQAVRTVENAIPGLSGERRRSALARIRRAKQPNREAKSIIAEYWHPPASRINEVDLSDAQELWATLLRRDGGIWSPQSDYLHKIKLRIVGGEISKGQFIEMKNNLLRMPQPLSAAFRAQEVM